MPEKFVTSENVLDTAADEHDELPKQETAEPQCGYWGWTPSCLQNFNIPIALLAAVSWFAFIQGWVVNGIVNVNTSTIERRFDLSSTSVAYITSSYEITAGLLAIPIGYAGTFIHKPRVMAVSALIMSLGSLVMFLPHILAGTYNIEQQRPVYCAENATESCSEDAQSSFLYIFFIGQFLHGVGGCALFTLAIPLMDENIRMKDTPLYIGIFQAFSALGPAVAFIVGGFLLNIYVDVGRVDDIDLTPSDPRWVGAWWIGFVVAAVMALTVSAIFCCFDRELPTKRIFSAERKSQEHTSYSKSVNKVDTDNASSCCSPTNMLHASWQIIRNPVFVLLTVAGTVELGLVLAFATFLGKVIQFQFSQTAANAVLLAGALVIPGAFGGQIIGGLIPRWLNLHVRGLIAQCLVCTSIALAATFVFLMRCPELPIAGVTQPYITTSRAYEDFSVVITNNSNPFIQKLRPWTVVSQELDAPCNLACNCSTEFFLPVCDTSGVTFFTPCHAGCRTKISSTEWDYSDCMCASNSTSTQHNQTVVSGTCVQDCALLVPFLIGFFIAMFATFTSATSGLSAVLRVLPENYRSFGIGIQFVFVRVFGNMPFPIIMGLIFDQSCLVWQKKCTEQGSCWIYDSQFLAIGLTITAVLVKTTSLLLNLTAFFIYKSPNEQIPPSGSLETEQGEVDIASPEQSVIHQTDNACVTNNSRFLNLHDCSSRL